MHQLYREQVTRNVHRVAVPGTITGQVTLLNGRTVPVVNPDLRGLCNWTTDALVATVMAAPFDVQEWIAAGKPVNPPSLQKKGTKTRSPLEVTIERGFHSLVQVLLQGGAFQEPEGYDCPMNRALRARRFDIVQLLVDHGFDPKAVDMGEIFASWDPEIMSYFVSGVPTSEQPIRLRMRFASHSNRSASFQRMSSVSA